MLKHLFGNVIYLLLVILTLGVVFLWVRSHYLADNLLCMHTTHNPSLVRVQLFGLDCW
jgi:hypothetical protein